jgi:hypothetical protein
MNLRFPVLVHLVMERLLSFLLISSRWGRYVVLDRVYILLVVVVSRMDAGHVGLVSKYMVFVNYVDQREASSVEADGDFWTFRVNCSTALLYLLIGVPVTFKLCYSMYSDGVESKE